MAICNQVFIGRVALANYETGRKVLGSTARNVARGVCNASVKCIR